MTNILADLAAQLQTTATVLEQNTSRRRAVYRAYAAKMRLDAKDYARLAQAWPEFELEHSA